MINSPYTARAYKKQCQGKQMRRVLYYHDCNKLIQWCQLWLRDSDYEIWCVLNLMVFSALLVSSLLSNVILCSHLSGNKRSIIDCASSVTTVCFTINCVSGPFYPGECTGAESNISQFCYMNAFCEKVGNYAGLPFSWGIPDVSRTFIFFKWLCSKGQFGLQIMKNKR